MRRDENRNSFNCSGPIASTLRSNSVSDKLTSCTNSSFNDINSCSLPPTMPEEHWAKAAWDKDGLGGAASASNCASNSETFDLRRSFCWQTSASCFLSSVTSSAAPVADGVVAM